MPPATGLRQERTVERPDMPSQLSAQDEPRPFWVWADLREPLVRESLDRSGEFLSVADVHERVAALPFVENPGFMGRLSPFGLNVVREYTVEYRLELKRLRQYLHYPSRLSAIFLFASEEDAWRYARAYPDRTRYRHLLALGTRGEYRWSWHDSAWIELMRAEPEPPERLDEMADAYWRGEPVPPSCRAGVESIREVLLLGRVAVQDRDRQGPG
jgi:hypothetical protein